MIPKSFYSDDSILDYAVICLFEPGEFKHTGILLNRYEHYGVDFSEDDAGEEEMISTRLKTLSQENKQIVVENNLLKEQLSQLLTRLTSKESAVCCGMQAHGLMHNLKNPLTVIHCALGLFEIELKKDQSKEIMKYDYYLEKIRWIDSITQNSMSLIKNAMARTGSQKCEELINININLLIEQELKFLELNSCFKSRTVSFKFLPKLNLPVIKAIYSDLSQIIMNIVQNSLDAMWQTPQKKLTITTGMADSQHIAVEISDTGCGIAESELPRIFDLFYTTKPKENFKNDDKEPTGTGIGMYMTAQLAMAYQIKFEIKSTVGIGTAVKIIIPVKQSNSKTK